MAEKEVKALYSNLKGVDTKQNLVDMPFHSNIAVASNELFLRTTINRNLEKLLANDVYLYSKISSIGSDNLFSIQLYRETKSYSKGDVVLYMEYADEAKTRIDNVYILQSLIDNNENRPTYDYVDAYLKDFTNSGWQEPNPFFSLYQSTDDEINLSSFISASVDSKFHLSHELDLTYHRYGQLDYDTLSSKLLLNDVSNIADEREELFWDYEVSKVSDRNFNGFCRKWGNGVLEYDLTFCLGDEMKQVKTIKQDGTIEVNNFLKVNSLIPLSDDTFNNDDYFLDTDAYYIFNKSGSETQYVKNGIAQTNVTDQVNAYHGTLKFPIPFIDTNYMVFANGFNKQPNGFVQSPNAITFLNRKLDSITCLLVIPNYNGVTDIEQLILSRNVFQCQIIGRWKKKAAKL